MTVHGVGIDVADSERVAALLARHGEGFVTRWFTAAEIARHAGDPAGLGRCLAAKEAVWKSLRLSGERPVPWHLITVVEQAAGPDVTLAGWVAAEAGAASVGAISVAISATDGLLTAIAIAERAGAA